MHRTPIVTATILLLSAVPLLAGERPCRNCRPVRCQPCYGPTTSFAPTPDRISRPDADDKTIELVQDGVVISKIRVDSEGGVPATITLTIRDGEVVVGDAVEVPEPGTQPESPLVEIGRIENAVDPIVGSGGDNHIRQLAFANNGTLVSIEQDTGLRIWDTNERRLIRRMRITDSGMNSRGMSISTDREMLATLTRSLDVYLLPELKLVASQEFLVSAVLPGVGIIDESTLVGLNQRARILVLYSFNRGFQDKSMRAVGTIRLPGNTPLYHSASSPDGRWLTVGGGGTHHFVDIKGRKVLGTLEGLTGTFSTDSQHLFLVSGPPEKKTISMYDTESRELVAKADFEMSGGSDVELHASPDGRYLLAAAGRNDRLRMFSLPDLELISDLEIPCGAVAISADGKTVATTGGGQHSKEMRRWYVHDDRSIRLFRVSPDSAQTVDAD